MTEKFLHGVEVSEVSSGPRTIRTAKSSVIGLIGTAPDADIPINKPVLITRREDLGTNGTLPAAIKGIFDQIGALVVVIRVEENEVEAGIQAFLTAENILHVTPRILIAPGFTQKNIINSMVPVAESLRAIIIADGPNTNDQDAITYRRNFSSSRVYIVDPWIKTSTNEEPPSPYVAGLIAKSDNERGFWWSPSNQEIYGITGTARPVDFTLGETNCRANLLNENEVATIIHQGGYRLWGNRSCSNDPKWAFLSVRRTADLINDSLLRAHLWAVDRNITRTYSDDVVESVNAYLAHLKAIGAILGGRCYPRQSNIEQGKVCFDFDFTPPYPAEHISFRSHLVNDYIKELV